MVHLANQFFKHTIERRYWALVWGNPAKVSEYRHRQYRAQAPMTAKVFAGIPEAENGKYAVTHWRVLERFYRHAH
ncbi:MAG: hypothetical protein IPM98_11660 [Lewinellaceae bacterium]|nr:hypothetical protein [Lewinellaceae bacterium]